MLYFKLNSYLNIIIMASYLQRLQEANSFMFALIMAKNRALGIRLDQNEANDGVNLADDVIKHALIGDYKWSARNSDFNGWLVCDGRSLSRDRYTSLFHILGTAFGANDATTFKLPDARGRTACAVGQGQGLTNRALGAYVGSETHTLTTNEIPGHTHTGTTVANGNHDHSGNTSTDGNHTHTVNDPGHTHTQTTTNDDFNIAAQIHPALLLTLLVA